MSMRVLLYGLQRSGTNYLEQLLKRRLQVTLVNEEKRRDHAAHKHFRLYDEKALVPEPKYLNDVQIRSMSELEAALGPRHVPDFYIVTSKDPYSWYLSFLRWGQKCEWRLPEHHYAQEYNLFYKRWLGLAKSSAKIVLVRYIDLLGNEDEVIASLGECMHVGRRSGFWGRLWRGSLAKVPRSDRFTDEQRDYYLEARYLEEYDRGMLESVNLHLDQQVVEGLGYEMVSPTTITTRI